MQLSLQLSKLQGTTSYFDGNMGRVGVKSDTVLSSLQKSELLKLIILIFQVKKLKNWCELDVRVIACNF